MTRTLALVAVTAGLLAAAPAALAVTCTYDNVPAATLLVPHFRVARNGSTGTDIPEGGADTLCAVTNTGATGVVVHVSVFNKYGKGLLAFNVPIDAHDVVHFRMKDVLNGKLNVNPNLQKLGLNDACFSTPGFGPGRYVRFQNPDSNDRLGSVSIYAIPAFTGAFRARVWRSVDESGDVSSLSNPAAGGILDADNPGCGVPAATGTYAGDFSGYLTLDVVNYCTNYFADGTPSGGSTTPNAGYFTKDALATTGWRASSGGLHSPNVLMGDVFFVDPNPNGGNISGTSMVALEFDARLDWTVAKTFYGRYDGFEPEAGADPGVPAAYRFRGDGREPLGTSYAFRFLADGPPESPELRTWAVIWRSDRYAAPGATQPSANSLCDWYAAAGALGGGLADAAHRVEIGAYGIDGQVLVYVLPPEYRIYLESQRLVVSPNANLVPSDWKGGWLEARFTASSDRYHQAWVGVQHSGTGLGVSVGDGATLLTKEFLCSPRLFTEPASRDDAP